MKKKNIFVLMLVLVLGIFVGVLITKNSPNSEQVVEESAKINADSRKESESVNSETEDELMSEQMKNEDSEQVKNDVYEQEEEQLVEEPGNPKELSESEIPGKQETSSEQGTISGEEVEIPSEPEIPIEPDVPLEETIPVEKNPDVNADRIEEALNDGFSKIVVSTVDAKRGENVSVTATLVNNPGVLGMSLTLIYDESALELVSAQSGEVFEEILNMTNSQELRSGCVFLWDGEEILPEQVTDGSILELEFKVLDDAPLGKQPITIICEKDGAVNNDLQTVYIAVDSGMIKIKE